MIVRKKWSLLLVPLLSLGCAERANPQLSYQEIVACAGFANTINGRALEMFEPGAADAKRLADVWERITDSIITAAEREVNRRSLKDIESYKKDVHEYAKETFKAAYAGTGSDYKSSLYLSESCGELNTSGLTLLDEPPSS